MLNFLIKNKIGEVCAKRRERKVFRNLQEVQSILVIFETEGRKYADFFISNLKKSGKKVWGCECIPKRNKSDIAECSYQPMIIGKDTDWMGVPSESIINTLKLNHYELIIDLSVRENFSLGYLLASLDASLKAGLKKNDFPLYDVSIVKTQNLNLSPEKLGEVLLFYLRTIGSGYKDY